MSVYTYRFHSEDDYHAWIAQAGPRIKVVSLKRSLTRVGAAGEHRPVELRYETSFRSLKPHHLKGPGTVGARRLPPAFAVSAIAALVAVFAMN
ncbi:MAG TPA: hypothetical protein VEJ86_10685 [Candidatus Binataceae bacterium]|nr:hypothetical protein [Candidatus Binataceae bacterium]